MPRVKAGFQNPTTITAIQGDPPTMNYGAETMREDAAMTANGQHRGRRRKAAVCAALWVTRP
jgi:hypothetical protein